MYYRLTMLLFSGAVFATLGLALLLMRSCSSASPVNIPTGGSELSLRWIDDGITLSDDSMLDASTFKRFGMYNGVFGFGYARIARGSDRDAWLIQVPYAVPFLVPIVIAILAFRRLRRIARLAQSGHTCGVCGYDRRASPDRCPECGAVGSEVTRGQTGARKEGRADVRARAGDGPG